MGYNYEEEQRELMRHMPEDWELSIFRWDSIKTLLVDMVVSALVFLTVLFGVIQLGIIKNQQQRILDLEMKMDKIEQKTAKLDVIYDYDGDRK